MRERRECRPIRPMVCVVLAGMMATSLPAAATNATSDGGASAREILAATGVRGGLVVQVGCGDGRLAAALGAKKGFLVHGLDADPAHVKAAREHVRSAGLYGRVAIDHWTDCSRLPYADNLVNLVVAGASSGVSRAEISRVLCPNGVAYVQGADRRWTKTVKLRPREIDEWTHYLYDASNNAVSHDAVVGPPRHLQWVGSPRWARHHDHMASMSALVAAGGRIFYIMDEGPKETILLPPVWYLVARDAFNGVVLWKRPIETWCTAMWPLKSGPSQLPRRLIADGRAVYVTMGIDAPVSVLDPATGQTRRTFEGTKFAEEMILSNGVLFVQCPKGPSRLNSYRAKATDIWRNCRPEEGAWDRKRRTVVAIDLASGRALWKGDHAVAPLTLTADAKRVYYFDGERVVGLDCTDGRRLWQSEPTKARKFLAPAYSPTLVVHGETVLLSAETGLRRTAASMHAFDASTGRKRWSAPHLRGGHQSPEDLIVMQGLVWCGSAKPTGRDIATGEKRKEVPPDDKAYYFHHRCHRGKATDRYLLQSRTGIEFIDPVAKHWVNNNWVRGGCIYGIMPCNGLIYAPPHSCGCYLESKLFGFNALAAASPLLDELKRGPTKGRLEKGPAYGGVPAGDIATAARDWPTYRHDAARSGACAASGPAKLGAAWVADVGGRLSSVTVASGRVYVAAVDTHTVHALDAASGKRLWAYTTGGRVDSPPTIHGEMAIFGSADGWIYAVRAADGALAWRFRAAPLDRRVVAFEQLESCWPVSGSVLVRGRTVWAVAGRSAFLDGGLRICRLEADTGRLLSETVVDYAEGLLRHADGPAGHPRQRWAASLPEGSGDRPRRPPRKHRAASGQRPGRQVGAPLRPHGLPRRCVVLAILLDLRAGHRRAARLPGRVRAVVRARVVRPVGAAARLRRQDRLWLRSRARVPVQLRGVRVPLLRRPADAVARGLQGGHREGDGEGQAEGVPLRLEAAAGLPAIEAQRG